MESNYDPLFPDHPVADQYLSTWANFCTFGDKPAFRWVDGNCKETDSITYRDLNAAASTIASHLCQRKPVSFSKGDRVLVIYPPGLDFIQIVFGCQRAGLVIIPASPPNPAKCSTKDVERLAHICNEASPRAVFSPLGYSALLRKTFSMMRVTQAPSLDVLEALDWIDITSETSTPTTQPGASSSTPSSYRAPAASGCGASDIFLLQYTSGTTGTPKPVLVSAGSAAHNARSARRAFDLGPASVIATWLPQYHDCGLVFTLLTVVCGASTVMAAPRDFATRPCLWLEMLSQFRATCTVVPAFALPLTAQRHLQQSPPRTFNLACLQTLILINEPILLEDVHHFQKTFSRHGLRGSAIAPSYGLAENCTFVCTAWPPSPPCSGGYPSECGLLPVGRVPDSHNQDMDIRVVKPSSSTGTGTSWPEEEEAPEGSEGEIWVSSPSNASGYLALPTLTKRTFHAQLPAQPHHQRRSFVRTGDLGRVVDGFLYVTGRTQDVLLVRGQMLHPHLLERSVFRSSSGLRAGCCVAFQEAVVVVVVAEVVDEASWPAGTARRAWEVLHAQHGVSSCTVALVKPRSVPKTTSGKLRRNETRHLFLQNRLPLLECTAFHQFHSQQRQSRL